MILFINVCGVLFIWRSKLWKRGKLYTTGYFLPFYNKLFFHFRNLFFQISQPTLLKTMLNACLSNSKWPNMLLLIWGDKMTWFSSSFSPSSCCTLIWSVRGGLQWHQAVRTNDRSRGFPVLFPALRQFSTIPWTGVTSGQDGKRWKAREGGAGRERRGHLGNCNCCQIMKVL